MYYSLCVWVLYVEYNFSSTFSWQIWLSSWFDKIGSFSNAHAIFLFPVIIHDNHTKGISWTTTKKSLLFTVQFYVLMLFTRSVAQPLAYFASMDSAGSEVKNIYMYHSFQQKSKCYHSDEQNTKKKKQNYGRWHNTKYILQWMSRNFMFFNLLSNS